MKSESLVLILALVVSSVTLWLVESSLKYMLYFFEVVLIILLFYLLSGKGMQINFKLGGILTAKLDYVFPAISTLLLMLNALKIDTVLTMICAIIVSFFLPGYVLLRLLQFHASKSWIEWLALSFALSIGLTSILFTAVLPFTTYKALLLSVVYVGISLCPLLKTRICKPCENPEVHGKDCVKHDLSDVLLLSWVIGFFVFAISSLYPQMALSPGLDIVRLFSSSRLLTLAPETVSSFYPWFHMPLANLYELSRQSIEIFQTGLAYLSVVVIFSFYVMAKAYLKDVDRRAPILATVFFSVFAGFGWLPFFREKLAVFDSSMQLDLLRISSDASYMDVGYGQGSWLWFWFRPMTVAFTVFFMLLYLLSRKDIPNRWFIPLFSFLTLTLGLIHVPELVLFTVFLLVLVLFMPKNFNLRLKGASLATLIGCAVYFSYAFVLGIFGIVKTPSMDTFLILAITAFASYLITRKSNWQGIRFSSVSRVLKSVEILTLAIALVFIVGLLTWFSSPDMFSVSYVSETYYIPLMMYPILLGITGFFALHGLIVISKTHRNNLAVVCVILFLFVLVFGKFVSFINIEIMDLLYGERRFLPAIFAAVAMLASVSFLKQASKFIRQKKKLLLAIVVSLIIITGITSTTLSIEYWNSPNDVNYYALEAAEYLSLPSNREIRTPILTAPPTTRSLAEYIPSPYVVDSYRYPIWESRYPEATSLILYSKYYPPPYLYLTNQDFDNILTRYTDSYFTKHMFPTLSEAYSNPGITVYTLPEGTPPSVDSDVLLVIPNDESVDYLYAYGMLSLGQYEYTACLISDFKTIVKGEHIILPRDDEGYLKLLENLQSQVEFQQADKEILIFNFNGSGPLVSQFFEAGNPDEGITATQIKRPDFTLNLPIDVDVPPLKKKEGVNVLAWYSNGKEQVPFAAELESDNVKLIYINVYPIVKAGLKEVAIDSRNVLYLLMSELNNGSVKDFSINENDGYVYGAKEVNSVFGACLDFDEDSFIEVPHSDMLNSINEVTIEAWIQPRNPDKGFAIVSKKASYNSLDGYTFLFDGGTFYFNVGNGTNFSPNVFIYGKLEEEQWYHLAVTYDGHRITYYVDGSEVGSTEYSGTIAANDFDLLIGKRQDETWKLDGLIYKIGIYNQAFTQSEIEMSYNQTMDKFWDSNLISPILGSLIPTVGVELPAHVNYENWVYAGNTAFFKDASLNGNIIIKSPSFTELTLDGATNVTISAEQKQINMTDIVELYINEADYGEIRANETAIHAGQGFYTRLTLANPTSYFQGDVLITVVTNNQETTEIAFQNGQLAILGQVDLYARTPSIYVNGETKFKEMYSLFSIYPQLRSLGHDLSIHGVVEFQLPVSDVYTFASEVKWDGTTSREPPIFPWSEYDSIKNMLPWLIISTIFVGFWYAIFGKRTIESNNKEMLHEQEFRENSNSRVGS
jgi:hypothetical protein